MTLPAGVDDNEIHQSVSRWRKWKEASCNSFFQWLFFFFAVLCEINNRAINNQKRNIWSGTVSALVALWHFWILKSTWYFCWCQSEFSDRSSMTAKKKIVEIKLSSNYTWILAMKSKLVFNRIHVSVSFSNSLQ